MSMDIHAAAKVGGNDFNRVAPDALVSFDCQIKQMNEIGTHTIFFCEVQAIQIHPSDEYQGLIYFNQRYHQVEVTG